MALPYINKANYKPTGHESSGLASMTQPDETMSIRDLLARYNAGMPMEKRKVQYFDEEDISAINKFYSPGALDLTDLDELSQKVDNLSRIVKEAQDKREAENAEQVREVASPTQTDHEESDQHTQEE